MKYLPHLGNTPLTKEASEQPGKAKPFLNEARQPWLRPSPFNMHWSHQICFAKFEFLFFFSYREDLHDNLAKPGRGGGDAPKNGFLHRFCLKTGIHFAHLVWNRVWFSRKLRECMNVFIVSNEKWIRKKDQCTNSKWLLRNPFVWALVFLVFFLSRGSGFGEPRGTPPPGISPRGRQNCCPRMQKVHFCLTYVAQIRPRLSSPVTGNGASYLIIVPRN